MVLPKKLPKVLSRENMKTLLNSLNIKTVTGLKNRCLILTMYRAGLRIEEALSLAPEDVQLEEGLLYVQQGKRGKDRWVPIDQETGEWLKRWAAIRPQSNYFFCNAKGGKLEQRNIRKMVYRTAENAKVFIRDGKILRPVNPHTFRHTYATELLEEGFSIIEVQKLMGHSDVATTAIYLHVRDEELRKKVRARA